MTMLLYKVVAAGLLSLPALALAATPTTRVQSVEVLKDSHAVVAHFRSLGFKTHGGVEKSAADRIAGEGRTFPTFSSSFTVKGVTYPFTMVGFPPASGRRALIKSVIIPLRMNFVGFGPNQDQGHIFDPNPAVSNILHSPLYVPTSWAGGFFGQFVDSMQRAAFWNLMDRNHEWHVQMDRPRVLPPIDIEVTP
jgi:hypothetical protein